MTPKPKPPKDATLAALEEIRKAALTGDEPALGLSFNELLDATGFGRDRLRGLLRKAMRAKRLIVGFKKAESICGTRQTVPCYRIK